MKTKVVHIKKEPYDLYVGRPTIWGNPFSHKPGGYVKPTNIVATREEAVEKFREYAKTNKRILETLHMLKGKTLACWCAPKACHAHVLAEMADALK